MIGEAPLRSPRSSSADANRALAAWDRPRVQTIRALSSRALYGLCCSVLLFFLPLTAHAQETGQVTGMVTNAATGDPLEGAQVVVRGTEIGGLTGSDGQYSLRGVPTGDQTVSVRLIGYTQAQRSVSVQAGQTVTLNFRLERQALNMDEIVVTGTPGERQRRSLGNALGSIDADELNEVSAKPNTQNLLSNASPGVNVDFASGKVGAASNIRIRGASSIALSSSPLIYIDGIRATGADPYLGGGAGEVGVSQEAGPTRLNDLNPDDIERVEIVKGPSAATLYGSEASNGVINIITKDGQEGATQLRVTASGGINKLPTAAEDFFPNAYFRCQGFGECEPGEVVEFNVLRHDKEVRGENPFRWGPSQNYSGRLSGGSEDVRYYFSGAFGRDDGIRTENWERKLNGRSNLNWAPAGDLGIQFRLGVVDSRLRSPGANQSWMVAVNWACPAPGCERNSGSPWAMDGPFRGYLAYLPEVLSDSVFGFMDVLRTTGSVQMTHNPTDWLDQRLTVGGDLIASENSLLFHRHSIGSQAPQGLKQIQTQNEAHITLDYSATGQASVSENLNFSTSAGLQYNYDERGWSFSGGERFTVRGLSTVSAGAEKSAEEGFVANKSMGVYVQEEIAWEDRFFLTGAVRGDDNSAFGTNFDFVVYPKVSASWVLSDEPFLQGADWINNLKVRSAWGRSGQQPDAFAAVRRWRPVAGPGATGALVPDNIGNPDLKPEIGEEWETGFDASFLNERLGVEFTYYDQRRNDAMLKVPVKPSRGFPGTQLQNIGQISNQGVEFSVNGRPVQEDDVSLDLLLNLDVRDNEIESMGGLPPQKLEGDNPTTGFARQFYVEGLPLGAIFLKKVVSADIEGSGADGRAVNVMCEGGPLIPGTDNFSRGGGEPVPCSEAPEIFRGTPLPTVNSSGSATINLFDRWRLYAQLEHRSGVTMINGDIAGSHLFFRNSKAINEREDPILLGLETMGQDGINQAGLMDADFLSLRQVSATYDLPSDVAGLLGADRGRVTLAGRNLWMIWQATDEIFGRPVRKPDLRQTAETDSDPGGLSAYYQGRYPTLHNYTLRINLAF